MLHRLHPALMEFTRLTKTNWNPAECLSQTHGAALMATERCLCVQCSVTSQQWGSSHGLRMRGGGDRQDSSAVSPRRCTPSEQAVLTLLCSTHSSVTRTNQKTAWMFKLHLSPFLSDHFPPVFCIGFAGTWNCLLLAPSFKLNMSDDMLLLALPHTLGGKWIGSLISLFPEVCRALQH